MGCASSHDAEKVEKRLDKIEFLLTELKNAQPPKGMESSPSGGAAAPFVFGEGLAGSNPLAPPPVAPQGGLRRSSSTRQSVSFNEPVKLSGSGSTGAGGVTIQEEASPKEGNTKRTHIAGVDEPKGGGGGDPKSPPPSGKLERKSSKTGGAAGASGGLKDPENISPRLNPIQAGKADGIKFAGLEDNSLEKSGVSRKVQQGVRAARRHFFEKFITPSEIVENQPTMLKCGWLGCAAMSISFLLDNSGANNLVPVDEMFANNNLALHYTNFTSVCMAELFDIVYEFVTTQSRCVAEKLDAEIISFDLETLEAVAESEEYTGDHGPVVSLSAFRKELSTDMIDTNAVHVFNYDPYVVQEANAKIEEEEEDDTDHRHSPRGDNSKIRKWQKKNMGTFAVLLSFNSTLHEVELATVHLGAETHVTIEKTSLQTLYNSCCVKDGYTKRPRGYIKIFRQTSASPRTSVPSLYPVRLLDGSTSKGMLSIALDPQISPHILAMGIACHLAKETLLPQRTANKGQLRGIAVSDICETLRLPLAVVTAGSTRTSLAQSFAYLNMYFAAKGLSGDIHLGVVPITRKDNADDGAPSLTIDDFETQLQKLTKDSGIIMVLNMDINMAQNVTGLDVKGETSHFAIVSRYDEKSKVITLADVSVKKFKKQWSAPMYRIYQACIGFGYLLLSNKIPEVKGNGAPRYGQEIMDNAKFLLPPRVTKSNALLEFPPKVYCITLIGYALHLMGEDVVVEDICYGSGFHLSFLLSDHLSLHDVARIARRFVSTRVDCAYEVEAFNLDKLPSGNRTKSLDDFRAIVKTFAAKHPQKEGVLIFNFSHVLLQGKQHVWNGTYGGSYAILTQYDAATDTVIIGDANPEQYYRFWKCPLPIMYEACCAMDPISDRAKGYFTITRTTTAPQTGFGVDIRNCMLHHPFKPPLSSQVTAIAAAVSELCEIVGPEEVIYSFYMNADGVVDKRFSLLSLGATLTMSNLQEMCQQLITRRQYPLELRMGNDFKSEADFRRAISDAASYTMCVVIYDVTTVFQIGNSWTGAGIIERLGEHEVVVCDSCPTRYGEQWSCTYETLWKACSKVPSMNGILILSVKK